MAHSSKGLALLQQASTRSKVLQVSEPMDIPPAESVPLCHYSVVSKTCQKMNGGRAADIVTLAQVQELLSVNASVVQSLLEGLELPKSEGLLQCAALCMAVAEYIRRVGVLPPSSDRACYTVRGKTVCDVDVAAHELVHKLWDAPRMQPDKGAMVEAGPLPAGLIQHSIGETRDGLQSRWRSAGAAHATASARGSRWTAHRQEGGRRRRRSLWEDIKLLANFFRIFPSSSVGLVVSGPRTPLAQSQEGLRESDRAIARANAQAKAWVSTVLIELANWRTGVLRAEWFGGSGALTRQEVRTRISRTMSFIDRELDSIRYVYPADAALDTGCGVGVVAYVWKLSGGEQGYEETEGPLCSASDDPMAKHCGVDAQGRYFVYLCKSWQKAPESSRISTLVHEAAHHTGPRDVTYDREQMKALEQSLQLDNAANFENFAQAVAFAAWGCSDSAPARFSFTCSGAPCSCAALASYCDDGKFGPEIRAECPGTCGSC